MVSGGNGVAAPSARLLTIDDDDGLPTLTLALTPATIGENGGVSTVTASLSGVTDQATIALITVTPVDPAQSTDITLSSNARLTIAAGATESTGTVTITGVDNSDDGPAKRVLVEARVAGGNGVAEPDSVTLTVEDDEPSPAVTLHLAAKPDRRERRQHRGDRRARLCDQRGDGADGHGGSVAAAGRELLHPDRQHADHRRGGADQHR